MIGLFLVVGVGWTPAAVPLRPTGVVAGDRLGASIGISGDVAIAGAPGDGERGPRAGAAHIFRYGGGTWSRETKRTAGDGIAHDGYGGSVAVSGDLALVGAPRSQHRGFGAGAAYVLRRQAGGWVEDATLTAADGAVNDHFGGSVAIDGDLAVVGAYRADDRSPESGAVYVFGRDGGSWRQTAKLIASDRGAYNRFGWAVAVSDGCILVGAPHDDDRGGDAGAAYLFRQDGNGWREHRKLLANDGAAGAAFGFSVALSGPWAAVGAVGDDGRASDAGAVYLFDRGSNWGQTDKLTAPDSGVADRFGASIALSGGVLVVGAPGADRAAPDTGAAYSFECLDTGWTGGEPLAADSLDDGDHFGRAVAVSAESSPARVIVGSGGRSSSQSGVGGVYAFTLNISTGPDIAVTPRSLTITRPYVSAPARDGRTANFVPESEQVAQGLNIPAEVRDYWKQTLPPPAMQPGGSDLPEIVDWRVNDTGIKHQGVNCGSCSAFAAAALVENLVNRAGLVDGVDLSEQVLISCGMGSCRGWYSDALIYLRDFGVPNDACYPYIEADGDCSKRCAVPDYLIRAVEVSPSQGLWGEEPSVGQMKAALQNGPLIVTMRVPDDGTFEGGGYRGGVYDYNGGDIPWATQSHAVLVVGYDDTQECFRAKNSWGANWGENGYFRIAYDDVTDYVRFGGYAATASGVYLSGSAAQVTLVNEGTDSLIIHGVSTDVNWLAVSPDTITAIPPGGRKDLSVSVIDWTGVDVATKTGRVIIRSNDPDESRIEIRVDAVPPPSLGTLGCCDVDGKNGVDLADAILSLQVLAGVSLPPDTIPENFFGSANDAAGDGLVGIPEAISVLRHLADG